MTMSILNVLYYIYDNVVLIWFRLNVDTVSELTACLRYVAGHIPSKLIDCVIFALQYAFSTLPTGVDTQEVLAERIY